MQPCLSPPLTLPPGAHKTGPGPGVLFSLLPAVGPSLPCHIPGELVKHVHQLHGLMFLLLLRHALHGVGRLFLHPPGHWVYAASQGRGCRECISDSLGQEAAAWGGWSPTRPAWALTSKKPILLGVTGSRAAAGAAAVNQLLPPGSPGPPMA